MHELVKMLGLQFDYTREMLMVGLILARILPMAFLTPFVVGQQAPPEVKMSLGVLFTILVWPLARGSMTGPIPFYALPFLLLMMKESMIGFAIGFANSGIFAAMETAGRFVDTVRGAAMSEVLNPSSRQRATPLGTLYSQLLLCIFVAVGGHAIFMDTFFQSFALIPINESIDLTPGLAPLARYMIHITSEIMGISLILSAPPLAATFITDLVFGILNRVAPQLNAYFMAMPVKAMGALIMVLAAMTPFTARLHDYVIMSLVAVRKTVLFMVHG